MNIYDSIVKPLLMKMPPEMAHRAALAALRTGLAPAFTADDSILHVNLWNRRFRNPLGLAAGFDKDAVALAPLLSLGFGHVEAGTVTPAAQDGNPQPRVFRDAETESVINRMGFPGRGMAAFSRNLRAFRRHHAAHAGRVGVNIGFNKSSAMPVEDYALLIRALSPYADYIAINVSSPNTPGLRDFETSEKLDALLKRLTSVNAASGIAGRVAAPLLLKVSPDMTPDARQDIAALVLQHGIDGMIVSNTTRARPENLPAAFAAEEGGLSGAPLRDASLAALRDFYALTGGKVPLIGTGGIFTAEDAYARICAGASMVQVYTGLVFNGPRIVPGILSGLAASLRRNGFASVAEAVGSDVRGRRDETWLPQAQRAAG